MTARRRLRLSVATWLILQVVSLAALVPRDCCVGHRRQAEPKAPACHRAAEEPSERCSISGTCDGPMAALLAQLSTVGVLVESVQVLPDHTASASSPATRDTLTSRPAPPDPPPPRT